MTVSDLIRLDPRTLPWKPTDESVLVRTYDEYDIPLQGVIAQDGCFFLFECLIGRMTRPGVWIYVQIGPAELADLDAAKGQAFEEEVGRIFTTRATKLAMSIRPLGIVAEADHLNVGGGFDAALAQLADRFREFVDGINRSQREVEEMQSSPAWARMIPAG